MADGLDQKRIFLVASSSPDVRKRMAELIEGHISSTTIFYAQDGSEALSKLENAPPHVLLIEPNIHKTNGWQVVNHLLEDKKFKETAVIFLSPLPEQERFTDEVVVGRVQYVESSAEPELLKGVAKALNYVSHGALSEFYLRFLAPGDVLIKEGEKANFVYLVRRGSLRAYLRKEGGEITIGVIQEGEFVGEMAYINKEPRSADVIATTDCELIEIPVNHLDQLLFQKPSWAKALMITLSNRVKRANEVLKQKASS
jgi:CRP/FNR family cyclic AMP-dependent transcriptional regulator